jgi:hypothetical protein
MSIVDRHHLIHLVNFKNNVANLIIDYIDNNPLYRADLSARRAQIHARMDSYETRFSRVFQLPPSLPRWSHDSIYQYSRELMEILSDIISYQFEIVHNLAVRIPPF